MIRLKFGRVCAIAAASIFILLSAAVHASDDKVGPSSDQPSVSPTGDELVFGANFNGPTRIWISSMDGSGLREVSSTPLPTQSITHASPAWSPDGQRIAYVEIVNGVADVWVMQAGGAYPAKLTANGASNTQPSWSPDGTTIVFVSDKVGTKDLWLMNSNGSNPRRLTDLAGEENSPRFSPGGENIVFSETVNDSANLMVIGVNGTGLRQLTSAGRRDWEPYWGPGGIVFSSDRDTAASGWKIWTVNSDGSGLRKLGDVFGHDPIWTRDGRVVYTDERTSSRALSTITAFNPATGNKQVIVDVQGFLTSVDIQPRKQPNRVNPRSNGPIDVAIFSSATFDAFTQVRVDTLTFGATGNELTLRSCDKKPTDVNGDGIPDLVCRFELRGAGFQTGSTVGVLRFLSASDVPYEGRDAIVTVPKDD